MSDFASIRKMPLMRMLKSNGSKTEPSGIPRIFLTKSLKKDPFFSLLTKN